MTISEFRPNAPPRARSLIALAALTAMGAQAMELNTGTPDWSVRFDNTVKASTIYRIHDADSTLADSFRLLVPGVPASAFPQALNFNAGDDNFRKKGFVSKRVDLLSEFDAIYRKDFGLRLSGAAWYDASYHGGTDAQGAFPLAGPNGQTPYNEFPDSTRKLAGQKAELLDAFVFGGWDLSDGRRVNLRLGRHAVQYGESLFFGDNGIAAAQGPVDIFKLQSSPNAQFKEIIRPVPQVSANLQFSPDVSVGGYYQFRWEANRMPPAGSYFATLNNIWSSPLPEFLGANTLVPGADAKPRNSGQFGLQLKWRTGETDLGFYAARYHDKSGQLHSALDVLTGGGQWYYVFPEGIKTVGMSASRTFGDTNFSVEGSLRDNMPLVNGNMVNTNFSPPPQYATGRTAHVNVSWLTNFGPNLLARESSMVGEIAWNRVLKTHDPDGQLDPVRTRDATAIQLIYTPSYRQVLPGLDLGVPVGLRYVLDGNSSITGLSWGARGTGQATVGLEGTYQSVWQFSLTYSHYIGKSIPMVDLSPLATGGAAHFGTGNPLADRDFIALSLRRTF
jgi:hypothetical protein